MIELGKIQMQAIGLLPWIADDHGPEIVNQMTNNRMLRLDPLVMSMNADSLAIELEPIGRETSKLVLVPVVVRSDQCLPEVHLEYRFEVGIITFGDNIFGVRCHRIQTDFRKWFLLDLLHYSLVIWITEDEFVLVTKLLPDAMIS